VNILGYHPLYHILKKQTKSEKINTKNTPIVELQKTKKK
jgi:hypothetical protein